MCVTVTYRCPLCRTPAFTETPHICDEDREQLYECAGHVNLDRWITSKQHVNNWFCSNDICDYSRVSLAVAELEVEDIIVAQKKGYLRPPLPKVPAAESMEDSRLEPESVIIAREPIHNDGPLSNLPGAPFNAPVADMGQGNEVPDPCAKTPGADSGDNDKANIKPRPCKKPWVDISTLDQSLQREIRELRVKIKRLGPKPRALSWWAKCETQLLGICTNLKIPIRQTLTYIPRHDLHECNSRLAHLRAVDKRRAQYQRQIKVPVTRKKSTKA